MAEDMVNGTAMGCPEVPTFRNALNMALTTTRRQTSTQNRNAITRGESFFGRISDIERPSEEDSLDHSDEVSKSEKSLVRDFLATEKANTQNPNQINMQFEGFD